MKRGWPDPDPSPTSVGCKIGNHGVRMKTEKEKVGVDNIFV